MKLYKMAVIFWILSLMVTCVATHDKAQAKDAENKVIPSTTINQITTNVQVIASACPSDMVEIEGDYCPNLQTECLYNIDMDGTKHYPGDINLACGEYKNPSKCLSNTVHMHYCIDRFEWPNKEGTVPKDWMTFFDAQKAVESVGKRICTHKEWTLAAEGKNTHPLPYGNGYRRQRLCNFDNPNPGIDVFQSKRPDDEASAKLRALLVPSGSMVDCVSDFGVHDMSGNIDEWVVNESSQDMCIAKTSGNCRTGLMGGHIWHVRNASRPMTTAHGAGFGWYETGARACKDIK